MNVLFTIASIYYLRVSLCQETTIEPINTTEKFINQTNFLNNSTDITNKITNKPFSNITDLNKNGKTLNTIKLLKVFNETNSSKDVDKLNYTVLYSYLVKTDVYLKDNEKIIKKNNSIYLNVQNKLIDVYMEAFARQDQFKSLKGNYTDLNIFITNVTITNATKTSIIFFYSVLHQNISYSVDDLINVMSMITIQEMVLMMKRLIKLKIEAVHTPDTTNYGVLAVIVIFSIIGVLILAWFICCISVRTIRCIKNQNLIINDYIRIKRIQRQSCAINTIPIEILPEMKDIVIKKNTGSYLKNKMSKIKQKKIEKKMLRKKLKRKKKCKKSQISVINKSPEFIRTSLIDLINTPAISSIEINAENSSRIAEELKSESESKEPKIVYLPNKKPVKPDITRKEWQSECCPDQLYNIRDIYYSWHLRKKLIKKELKNKRAHENLLKNDIIRHESKRKTSTVIFENQKKYIYQDEYDVIDSFYNYHESLGKKNIRIMKKDFNQLFTADRENFEFI